MSLTVSIRDTIVFIYHEELCCNIYAFALTVFSYVTTIIFLSQYNHFNILNVMYECIDAMTLTTFLPYHIILLNTVLCIIRSLVSQHRRQAVSGHVI